MVVIQQMSNEELIHRAKFSEQFFEILTEQYVKNRLYTHVIWNPFQLFECVNK